MTEPLTEEQLASIERNRWHAPPTWIRSLVAEVRLARRLESGVNNRDIKPANRDIKPANPRSSV